MTGGRPLRFLALALGGWVMIRVAVLLPEIGAVPPSAVIPHLVKVLVPAVAAAIFHSAPPRPPRAPQMIEVALPAPSIAHRTRSAPRPVEPRVQAIDLVQARPPDIQRTGAPIPSPGAPPSAMQGPSRWHASAWLLVRGGSAGTVSGGQLGASQGGIRLTYALGARRRFALAARLAAPLSGAGREAAFGIEWQPTRLPIRIVAEQRLVLDGGRGGPTLGVIAGYGPSDIAPGIRVEAYGQAGAIARDGIQAYVDASARVLHPVGEVGGARVDIGVGAWASAQRDAARFDIGPSMVVTVPVARKTIRLTLEWRDRIAGAAQPESGPALSIGSDF